MKHTRLMVGTTVRIRAKANDIHCHDYEFLDSMERYLGKDTTIKKVIKSSTPFDTGVFYLDIDNGANYWTEPWLERVITDEKKTRFEMMNLLLQ